jgi:hypothetical protein
MAADVRYGWGRYPRVETRALAGDRSDDCSFDDDSDEAAMMTRGKYLKVGTEPLIRYDTPRGRDEQLKQAETAVEAQANSHLGRVYGVTNRLQQKLPL